MTVTIDHWIDRDLPPGGTYDVRLPVSESYTGVSLHIPIRVVRSPEPGPVVSVTAALHGDELNGTGAIRQLINDSTLHLRRGSLIFVPVLNLLAFDRHSRYLPDRRDLNRCFPGSPTGSSAARVAHQIFTEILGRATHAIDLHTAAVRRTNYPQVRGDLRDDDVREMATAFGAEVIVDCPGVPGTLRRESTARGCPTIILEGGEVWKVEPSIVATAVRGVRNVLSHLDMIDAPIETPQTQVVVSQTRWVRAAHGGFLHFHVTPGQTVRRGQPLATNTDLIGHEIGVLTSPFDGVLLGMTTLPSVAPGEPVCHIGRLAGKTIRRDLNRGRVEADGIEQQAVDDLRSNILAVDPDEVGDV